MNHGKKLGLLVCVFLGLFLFLSLPQAQSAEATGNAPIMVASQEATIPLTANAVTGAADTECPYKLTLKMGALFLHREGNNKNYHLFSNGPLEVRSHDLNLGWATGTDDSLMFQNKDFGVELRYFGALGWSESKHGYAEVGAAAPFIIGLSAKDKSWLNNGELNLHWWPCANDRYSLIMGVRYLRLNERLTAEGFQEPPQGAVTGGAETLSTVNHLWGGQLGVEGLLFGKRDQGFSLDGVVKLGMFHNAIHNKYHAVSYSDSVPVEIVGGSWSRAVKPFFGELGLNANYAFTKNIAVTVGYQFLYLHSVCLISQEYSTQSVIFNGIRTGLNITF
jgi:hypothetical protein